MASESPAATAQAVRPAGAPALEVRGLSVEFAGRNGWMEAVSDLSFSVAPRRTLGLVGESGCGKSTTALAIMGLLPRQGSRITGGSVFLDGAEDLLALPAAEQRKQRGAKVSMIFQEPMSSLNPAFTIGEQIAEAARFHLGLSRREAWTRAVQYLDLVEIPRAAERAKDYPHMFSGGQLQRVMIALALVCEPSVLLADEPTTALDVTIQAQVLRLIMRLQGELGMAVVLITHDLGVVAEVCDDVTVMYAGQAIEKSGIGSFVSGPAHPYSRGLLECMPQLGEPGEPLKVIPGVVPRLDQLPGGCRFNPRCPYRVEACTHGLPELVTRADGRSDRCVRAAELGFAEEG